MAKIKRRVFLKNAYLARYPHGPRLRTPTTRCKLSCKPVFLTLLGVIPSFVSSPWKGSDLDVNKRYIHSHTFLEELKPVISRLTTILTASHRLESENFRSSIAILRITSAPQACLSLAQTVNDILTRILHPTRERGGRLISARLSLASPRGLNSTIKSARGIEYSKHRSKNMKKLDVNVGAHSPGVEFNKRVLSLYLLTVVRSIFCEG